MHWNLFKGFKWISDFEKFKRSEVWEPVPKKYLKKLKGDCDLFARVACKRLREKGFKARLIYCRTENVGEYHLICESGGYISDNRHKSVQTVNGLLDLGYKFVAASGFKSGQDWHRIKG